MNDLPTELDGAWALCEKLYEDVEGLTIALAAEKDKNREHVRNIVSIQQKVLKRMETIHLVDKYIQRIAVDREFYGDRGEIVDNLEDILDGRLSTELEAYLK